MLRQKGFTLIELLITIVIVAILAAIALPSYQRYIVHNAEASAQAHMKALSIELEAWRATALTYKGFKPKKIANNGATTYEYDDSPNNTFIYFPVNSDASNYQYKLTIADNAGNTLAPAPSSTFSYTTASNTWRILAEPNTTFANMGASRMLLTSENTECKSTAKDSSFTITSSCSGKESW